MKAKARYKRSDGEDVKWWDSLFNFIPGALSGAADLTKSIKGTPDNYYVNNPGDKNNTGVYIAIAGSILAVIVVLALAFGGSKR